MAACGDDAAATSGNDGTGTESSSTSSTSSAAESSGESSSSESSSSSETESSSTETSESSSSTTEAVTCGDDIADGTEVCDGTDVAGQSCEVLGLGGGELGCANDCSAFDTTNCAQLASCGNGFREPGEACDGFDVGPADCVAVGQGFNTGLLTCLADCSGFDTSLCSVCGDGIVEGIEPCDGVNLGGSSCVTEGFTFGTLACENGCAFFDTSSCLSANQFGNDGIYQALAYFPFPLPCDDISASGTQVGLCDDCQASVPIGFSFSAYGSPFTTASIGSNGTFSIGGNAGTGYSNGNLPSASPAGGTANNFLAPFWDDLNPGNGGTVRYQTLGEAPSRRFVAQWNITFYSGGNGADLLMFRVVLHETTNVIDVCYVDTISGNAAGNNGASATVGFQRNSTNAFVFSYNQPNVTEGLVLSYIPL